MSSLRPAPQLLPNDATDKGPGSGSGPGGSSSSAGGGSGSASSAVPGASPLVCQKCKRSVLIHDEKAVTEHAVLTFASGHLCDSEEEKAKMVQRDTWAIEQLGEAFVMQPTARYTFRQPKDALTGNTAPAIDPDKKMAAIQTLFEIATERTSYDMPLCSSCSDAILAENDKRLKALEAYDH